MPGVRVIVLIAAFGLSLSGSLALAPPALAQGDAAAAVIVHTRDGQRLKGTLVEETESSLTLEGNYGTLSIDKRDVVRREREPRTLQLADGSIVIGEVVREDEREVIVNTAYGALAIPKDAIRADEGVAARGEDATEAAAEAAGARPPVDPARVRRLHLQGGRLHQAGRYREAIAAYAELLELAPGDDTALYNTACAHALLGERAEAVAFLRRSIAAGFVSFDHIRADTDLDGIRQEAGYKRLLAEEASWVRKAAAKATERLLASLRAQGAKGDYRVFRDDVHSFIYLHGKSEERFAAARAQLEDYARLQWRDLFRNKVREPLHIVLLTREDGDAVLEDGVGGYFNPATNILVCGDIPQMTLNKSNVVVHELTHALHFADQQARQQPHPIWLVEGLASLFETSVVIEDRLVPRHSARLTTVQAALRRGRVLPWRRIMQMDQPAFMAEASLAYAQSRYMLLYMSEKGYLKSFYDEYTKSSAYQGDKTALEAFEVVFGKPIDEVQRDWEAWIAQQQAPPIPFIGIGSEPVEGGLRITEVVRRSGAARGGIAAGDVIVGIDGTRMQAPDDLLEVLSTRDVGDEIEVEVRRAGQTLRLKVTLGERP